MDENEMKEMLHIKELLKRLQELQLSLYGNGKVAMSIDMSTYRHGISVDVWTKVDMFAAYDEKELKSFSLRVWDKPKHNENICEGIIRYVQKHSA